ncbi:MFS general substrate transporter [Cytidiella melzeri]|nr:MFS general substrate transporter [Cytidiella melzeri]
MSDISHSDPHSDEKELKAGVGEEQVTVEGVSSQIDLYSYHETNAGRLVIDPAEARIEFGDEVADKLKLSQDGTIVLWPQPRDDPDDPQNWSNFRKNLQLFIITLAAIVPDFDSGIGIADVHALAVQFRTSTTIINSHTSSWSIFLFGWGGMLAVILMRRYGRLPILFWSQLLALGFAIGCTFSPNLRTFNGMRCLTAFFATCPQATGLYIVTDLFPFHLQARKLNIWTMGFIISPFLSPFAFGFMVARTSWRWTYGIGAMYIAIVVGLIALFGEETLYDRKLTDPRPIARPASAIRYRIETLVGITGARMAKYRSNWANVVSVWFNLVWRPHLFGILLFEAMLFGFSIGVNVTNTVFVQLPPPLGYKFSQFATAGVYATPIVAVLIGEILGRYLNDWVMRICIRRNNGVFEAESRLWTCYIAVPMYICGFVLIGASFQNHLSVGALVMGWGIAEVAVMFNTVAVYAYCNACFPRLQGEVSALLNLARTLGGFSVAYFQVVWATKNGALQTFGCEAAIVGGLFLFTVPVLQLKGKYLRKRFSL